MSFWKREQKSLDLLTGPIMSTLVRLALPIMTTGFMYMAYSLTDVFWLAKVESGLVAAGTCGILLWLCEGFSALAKIGASVNTAAHLGRKNIAKARENVVISLKSTVSIALLICLVFCLFNRQIIGFFHFQNPLTIHLARTYLVIVSFGIPFTFLSASSSAASMANGNSKMPFLVSCVGLVLNIIFDPIFIFVFNWGVAGAAWATIMAQMVGALLMFYFLLQQENFKHLNFLEKFNWHTWCENIRLGTPVALQTVLVSMVAMAITRIVNNFSESAIAAQRLGVQIESLSWLTADSFGGAVTAMVAQNYAAEHMKRTYSVIKRALTFIVIFACFTTCLLYFYPDLLLKIFTNDKDVIKHGINYLQIIAYSQVFMCTEIVICAVFNGFGRTTIPAIVGVVCTAARIPLALYLSSIYGIRGIWWALSICSIILCLVLCCFMVAAIGKLKSDYSLQ